VSRSAKAQTRVLLARTEDGEPWLLRHRGFYGGGGCIGIDDRQTGRTAVFRRRAKSDQGWNVEKRERDQAAEGDHQIIPMGSSGMRGLCEWGGCLKGKDISLCTWWVIANDGILVVGVGRGRLEQVLAVVWHTDSGWRWQL
jgi:hypothetical protein